MPSRDELKAMIDQLPESSIEQVHALLNFHVNPPPPPPPEMERMRRRGQEFKKMVEQRFRETLKPGTGACGGRIGGMSGGSFSAMHEGTGFAINSFHYWDNNALVKQTLQSFDGQDIEIMERFAVSPDRKQLLFTIELATGGQTIRYEDEFPYTPASQ